MDILFFDKNFPETVNSSIDILSAFKQKSKKSLIINQNMSDKDISEVVSEKIINIVKEQFQVTEENFRQQS